MLDDLEQIQLAHDCYLHYEKKVKAWRLIGKPLTFTKVLHGARMERRRVFFEKNGIWKPGDAQKGTQKATASCVVHCRSFQQLQMEMKEQGRSAELLWIDLEDGYPSTRPADS